jgi:hypothetical protein
MKPLTLTVRVAPDTLVKIYDETRDEVIYIDNTNDDGETTPVTLKNNDGNYYIDLTMFTEKSY